MRVYTRQAKITYTIHGPRWPSNVSDSPRLFYWVPSRSIESHRELSGALESFRVPSRAISCHREPSSAIRCHREPSGAIRCHREPSGFMHGLGYFSLSGIEDQMKIIKKYIKTL